MPTPVTRFQAEDGKEFKTELEAKHHERALQVLGALYPGPDHLRTWHGEYLFLVQMQQEGFEITGPTYVPPRETDHR